MKRIATLTFHNTTNYGALLQALALQKKLESLGVDTEVLDYHCRNIEQRENIALPSLEKNIYHYLAKWKDYCVHSRKRKVISDFRDRYMKISDTSYDRSTIHDSIDKYDAFIVGSDMVWELGITGGDFTYFLDFAPSKKRFSYAASIGVSEFNPCYRGKVFAELQKFRKISVREDSAASYLQANKISNITVSIDPTLLFDGAFWERYEEEIPCLVDKKYILLYFLDEKGVMLRQARELSKKSNAEIVVLSDKKMEIIGCKVLTNVSVGQFLFSIHNAFVIITGSFHGMIYSLNYNRNFMYYNRANSTRMESIARIVGATSRRLTAESMPDIEYDFSQANNYVESLRQQATAYLKQVVDEV